MSLSKIIANLAKSVVALKSTKLTFGSETLKNGTEISFVGDSIEVGLPIDIIDSDGTISILPDGDYETESGISFTVAEGVVTEVKNPETPAEEVEQKKNEVDFSAQLSDLKAELSKKFAEQNAVIAKLSKIVQALADQPSGEAGQAVGFSKKPAETKSEAKVKGGIAALAAALQNQN